MRVAHYLLSLTALALAASLASAGNIESPVRDGSLREQQMLIDARDGRLDDFTLLDAALLTNGIYDVEQFHRLSQCVLGEIAELQPQARLIDDPMARVQLVFERMHERILRGEYQSDCTQLARALNEGHYNCVSATILFHVLAQSCDLYPVAVATPTHVYSRLHDGSDTLDIQTTCARWFQMSPEQQQRNTPVEVNSTASELPREISDVQLLAKIYYNRGVRHLEAERFDMAEIAFRVSLQLDADDLTARENLLASLNNWALTCSDAGDYAAAARLLRRGCQIDADYGPFRTNDLHIHQRWAQHLCEEGEYERAAELLEQGRLRQPEAPLFRDGPAAVYRMWAASLAERGDRAAALTIIDQGLRRYPGARELVTDRAQLVAGDGR